MTAPAKKVMTMGVAPGASSSQSPLGTNVEQDVQQAQPYPITLDGADSIRAAQRSFGGVGGRLLVRVVVEHLLHRIRLSSMFADVESIDLVLFADAESYRGFH